MIEKKTAFIIGAGASKAYSLPTGEDLRQEIFNMRVNYGIFANPVFSSWYQKDKYLNFIDTFKQSGLKSIDTFLKVHPEFENEGKACISYLIKTHEMDDYEKLYNKNDWLFLLYNKLVERFGDPENHYNKNNVYFITFNYDRFLEYYLINSFYNTFNNNQGIQKKFEKNGFTNIEEYLGCNIDHVYGKIGDLKTNPINQNNIENIPLYMNEIKIIGDRSPNINRIKERLSLYERIFFLGYGFDSDNNQLLELSKYCEGKEVYGTCLQNFDEEIKKIQKSISDKALLLNCNCNDLVTIQHNPEKVA